MTDDVEETVSDLIGDAESVMESLETVDPSKVDRENWEDELGEFLDAMEQLESTETRLYELIFDETSGKGRIREYLRDRIGEPVKSDRVARVSGISQYARRIRELRNEEGFVIDSTRTRAELGQNDYFVVEIRDVEEKTRIDAQTRYEQLQRRETCEICGRGVDHPEVKYMEVDHIESFVDFEDPDAVNDPENLRTLCNECHHGKSAADNIANRR
jgi:5-methylcytosine-specific restriction endonuclease McrA